MIKDILPFSNYPDVRERIDELFSRKMLGAVLVGKFVGDYTALKTVEYLGTDLGYLIGITVTIGLFVYWDRVERKIQQKKDELNPAQTQMGDFTKE